MGSPMKIRANANGDTVEVKILMAHPMETGRRKNAQGELIPAHHIQTVEVFHKDRSVLSADWGTSIAANPFLSFKFKGGVKGDKIKVTWVDSKGDSRTDEVTIN